MVDSLLLVRSDVRPSLVSFLSCLGEMTVADILVLLSAIPAILGGIAAWGNRRITEVRQLLVPKKMAKLHELQPTTTHAHDTQGHAPAIVHYNANINPHLPSI